MWDGPFLVVGELATLSNHAGHRLQPPGERQKVTTSGSNVLPFITNRPDDSNARTLIIAPSAGNPAAALPLPPQFNLVAQEGHLCVELPWGLESASAVWSREAEYRIQPISVC